MASKKEIEQGRKICTEEMKALDADIKSGELSRMYLLYGEETYLLNQYRDRLIKAIAPEGDGGMNLSSFSGDDIDAGKVIDIAETMPFFSDRRLIVVEGGNLFSMPNKKKKDDGEKAEKQDAQGNPVNDDGGAERENGDAGDVAENAETKKADEGTEDDDAAGKASKMLAEYIGTAPESTYFIFVENKADKRTKLYKNVAKAGRAVEFVRQGEAMLSRWVIGRIKKEGKQIKKDAYDLFIRRTGTDMENISRELEKLLSYTMGKDAIEAEDVRAITTGQTENNIFQMIDAVSEHKPKEALDFYYDLLALKEPPLKILYLLTNQFRRLMVVKSMTNQGFSDADIAKSEGCPTWAVGKYKSMCRAFTVEQLRQALRDGVTYNEAIRAGKLDERMAVELYLCQYSKADARAAK